MIRSAKLTCFILKTELNKTNTTRLKILPKGPKIIRERSPTTIIEIIRLIQEIMRRHLTHIILCQSTMKM